MKEVKEVTGKISDNHTLEAYEKYQTHERMLKVYEQLNSGAMNTRNVRNPAKMVQRIYEKNGFVTDEEKEQVGEFVEYIEDQLNKHPQIEPNQLISALRDLTSQKNRMVIGQMITKFQKDDEFIPADLDSVAVFKNYGLYTAVVGLENLRANNQFSNENLKEILTKNNISIDTLNKAYKKWSDFDKQAQDPNNQFKVRETSKVVSITAAVLEMAPAEARRNLESLQRMNQEYDSEIGGVIAIKDEEENRGVLEGNQKSKEEYLEKVKKEKEDIKTEIKKYLNRHQGTNIEDFASSFKDYCKRHNVIVIPMKQIQEDNDILKDIPEQNQIKVEPMRASKRDVEDREVG